MQSLYSTSRNRTVRVPAVKIWKTSSIHHTGFRWKLSERSSNFSSPQLPNSCPISRSNDRSFPLENAILSRSHSSAYSCLSLLSRSATDLLRCTSGLPPAHLRPRSGDPGNLKNVLNSKHSSHPLPPPWPTSLIPFWRGFVPSLPARRPPIQASAHLVRIFTEG